MVQRQPIQPNDKAQWNHWELDQAVTVYLSNIWVCFPDLLPQQRNKLVHIKRLTLRDNVLQEQQTLDAVTIMNQKLHQPVIVPWSDGPRGLHYPNNRYKIRFEPKDMYETYPFLTSTSTSAYNSQSPRKILPRYSRMLPRATFAILYRDSHA